jgi:anti-anti-sigma factor
MTEWLLTDLHIHTTFSDGTILAGESEEVMGLFKSRGRTVMNYEFVYEEDFLIIKLSGSAEVNERLSVKQHLVPYLQGSNQKVILDLEDLDEPQGVYIVGVLNTIKKEFQLLDGEVKLCSLEPGLYRYFEENRLDQIFDIGQSVELIKESFKERNHDS